MFQKVEPMPPTIVGFSLTPMPKTMLQGNRDDLVS